MTESRTEEPNSETGMSSLPRAAVASLNPLLGYYETAHRDASLLYISRPQDAPPSTSELGKADALLNTLSDASPLSLVVGPTLPARPSQPPADQTAWLDLLARRADRFVLGDGWESDPGCLTEVASALLAATPMFTITDTTLTELSPEDLSEFLPSIAPWSQTSPSSEAATWISEFAHAPAKDHQLAVAARTANTAYFASFAPHTGWLRYTNIPGTPGRRSDLIRDLLSLSASSSVNVRTFRLDTPQGNPFYYGLTDPRQVEQLLERVTSDGYFAIVNETIDQHDGGVSGVSLNGVVEFAPDATPRSVEQSGACRAPIQTADRILKIVYGPTTTVPNEPGQRVEFSCHPRRVGAQQSSTLVWESGPDQTTLPVDMPHWPNAFSRHIGDKTFGLVIAHLNGAAVPYTRVISRRVAPFEFGTSTGTNEWWIRTAPTEVQPGLFTTDRGWRDPFELLAKEDPDHQIAAVLSQESVDAVWSGASAPHPDADGSLLEGVPGFGDDFMLGRQSAQPIPPNITGPVLEEIHRLETALGRVRIEWVWDGQRVWIVQLHRARRPSPDLLSDGEATVWLPFDPADGLDVLRALVARARLDGAGVLITRPVGVTSHVGDILRKAHVPGRFEA